MVALGKNPTPTPVSSGSGGSGFDSYIAQNGAATTSPTAQQQFPSQFAGSNIPGIIDKDAMLVVPGSGTSISDIVSTMPAGLARDSKGNFDGVQSGLSIAQMLINLVDLSKSNPDAAGSLQDSLILGGYLDPRSSAYTPGGVVQIGDATWNAYIHLLLDSANTNTDYQDLLNQKVASGAGEKKFGVANTSTTVDITNPQDARLTLAQVMERDLGRKPTNAEIAQFAGQLAGADQANPVTTTQSFDVNSVLNANGGPANADNTTVRRGGVNPEVEAENYNMQHNGGEMASTDADRVYQTFLSMLNGTGVAK